MTKLFNRVVPTAISLAFVINAVPASIFAEETMLTDSGIDYSEYVGTIENPAVGYTNTIWAKCKPGNTPVYSPTGRLVLFFIDIGDFSSGINGAKDYPLDDAFFDSWSKTFENCRANGCTVALRFRYDANGKENPEPASFDAMLSHIDQLKEHRFFEEIGDILMYVESGFVGKWGEQHGGKYTSLEYKAKLLQKMLETVPDPVPVTVRTPNIFTTWAGIKLSDIADEKLIDSLDKSDYCPDIQKYRSRVGLYDDGYMGSDSDLGTYSNRELETKWLGRQTLTSYFGGEFSGDLDWAKKYETYLPKNAIPEMYKTHLSYINSNIFKLYKDYEFGEECDIKTTDNSAYYGQSVFQFIRDHIGYRYILRDSKLTQKTVQGGKAIFDFTVENTGFAGMIPYSDTYIILEKDGVYTYAQTSADCRDWLSCTKTENKIEVKLPDNIETGTWNVYFKAAVGGNFGVQAPDKWSVRFANKDTWNSVLGANLIGSIDIAESGTVSADDRFYVVNREEYATMGMYTYKDIITVDGIVSHSNEWSKNDVIASNATGQELSVRNDLNYLYVKAKMPAGAKAPVYNIQFKNRSDGENYWLYYQSNGFVYFNHDSYDGCQCKWQGDTVEFRIPYKITGLKCGGTIEGLRVFLQDSGNDWKLMGDIKTESYKIPNQFAVYSAPYETVLTEGEKYTFTVETELSSEKDEYEWHYAGKKIPGGNTYTIENASKDDIGELSVMITSKDGFSKEINVADIKAVVAKSPDSQLAGDANLDGKVTVSDAVAILQHIGNRDKYELKPSGLLNADVDGEFGVTAKDALIIQKVDAGLYKADELPLKKTE